MKKFLISLVLVLLCTGFSHAQVKSINGIVIEEKFSNKWAAIIIDAGAKTYGVQTEFHASAGDEMQGVKSWQVKTIGDVGQGRTVQVFYKKIDCTHPFEGIACWLTATRIVEI